MMQIPGAVLVIVYQGVINEADVSTWLPYLFVFLEELVLVVMIFVFRWRNRRKSLYKAIEEKQPFSPLVPIDEEM
jgi:hypothetical protein